MNLNTKPNLARADDFYERLINLHSDCSEEQSRTINARLILLLANHIGDLQVLDEAFTIAAGKSSQSDTL